jgi:endoglucanase
LLTAAEKVEWVASWFRGYNTVLGVDNPGGLAAVSKEFEMARAYAQRSGVRLYMGEFGAGDKADPESRVAWTCAVRREAERRGIGWAYWDDGGSFKVFDQKAHTWNAAMKAALLE